MQAQQVQHNLAGFWLNRLAMQQVHDYEAVDNKCKRTLLQCLQKLEPMQQTFTLSLLVLVLWGVTFSLEPSQAEAPHGQLFVLAILSISAHITGWLVSFLRLPPLLGMLLMGVLLRNIGFVEFKGSYVRLQGILRDIALIIILTRAGLGLDPKALKHLSLVIARLAVVPSLVEIIVSGTLSHYLFNLSWIWSFLLGSVLAAVSPAVVVPCLLNLKAQGYGLHKGIPTLIIAAASFDDIIGISIFRIVLSIIYSTGNLTNKILEGPLGVIYGISFGLFWGLTVGYFPSQNDAYVGSLRTLLIGAGGLLVMFGSNAIHFDGAGPLGCVVAAFVARQVWRKKGWMEDNNPVGNNYSVLWTIFQPILFGLIGTEIDLKVMELHKVGIGVACLISALVIRLLVSVLIASGANLEWKEKLFIAIAWFPKATVQAAIGPIALDKAKTEEDVNNATIVLMVAVLSILITAPIGAIFITLAGPKLLKKQEDSEPVIIDEERQHIIVNDGQE